MEIRKGGTHKDEPLKCKIQGLKQGRFLTLEIDALLCLQSEFLFTNVGLFFYSYLVE